jgi:hypothetical protein
MVFSPLISSRHCSKADLIDKTNRIINSAGMRLGSTMALTYAEATKRSGWPWQ